MPAEIDLVIESAIKKGNKKRKINHFKPLIAIAACLCMMVTGFTVYKSLDKGKGDSAKVCKSAKLEAKKLPAVNSYDNLQVLLKAYIKNSTAYYDKSSSTKSLENSGTTSKNSTYNDYSGSYINGDGTQNEKFGMGDTVSTALDKNYSNTDQQVKGVDEGDVVKTDGKYIYRIANNKVVIVNAVPAEKMEVQSQINFTNDVSPYEIFINGKYLTVICNKNSNIQSINNGITDTLFANNMKTSIYVYDISNKKKPSVVRYAEIDGNYAQSRMIGSKIYIIANKHIPIANGEAYNQLPICKDSAKGENGKNNVEINYSNVSYCSDAIAPNYIIIGCINLDKIKDKMNITTVLGSGNNIYVSGNSIYVAGDKYIVENDSNNGVVINNTEEGNTTIYKFSLNKDSVSFVCSGTVKGRILNQFSMDENKGCLRVATTTTTNTSAANNVYILNSEMKTIGSLESLAKGETIYSTRFRGDKLYMVTFKQTDPLYVIDLKVPESPKVLGELKIPGFSNYLEPYDDTHVIGFGQDAGNMKISLFDVSDVTKPKVSNKS